MQETPSKVPLVAGVVAIALVVGTSVWVSRSRDDAEPERAGAGVGAGVSAPAGTPVTTTARLPHPLPATRASEARPPVSPRDLLAIQAANDAQAGKLARVGESKLKTRFESERIDSSWAAAKQQVLERLSVSPQIDQVDARPLAMNARCRTSVCLIEADFPSRVAADDWFTLYALNAALEMSNSSARTVVNPDGTAHLTIYGLARQ